MGRVNFDKSIHDRKGITNKVEVVSGEQVKELKGWEVYNLPPFYEFVSQKNYQQVSRLTDLHIIKQLSIWMKQVILSWICRLGEKVWFG